MKNESRKERSAQWRLQIEEQQKSGLSQKEFCHKNGLALSKFIYHLGVIKKKDAPKEKDRASFFPVKIGSKETAASMLGKIRVSLPNGLQCSFPSDLDASRIRQWVEVLLTC